jgi:uncharacterized protein (DUF305 family)
MTTRRLPLVLLAVLAAAGVVFGAGALGYTLAEGSTPGEDSAEAGFARDMQVHHLQAVEMASIIHGKTDDETLSTVAYDMLTTQQHQVGQMFAWLDLWGLPPTGTEEPMTWMSRVEGHGEGPGGEMLLEDGRMPGMATDEELARLREATGVEAEVLFLELMIDHHAGGLPMAEAVVAASDHPEVARMARGMIRAQTSEIELMESLLAERRAAS